MLTDDSLTLKYKTYTVKLLDDVLEAWGGRKIWNVVEELGI